MDTLTYFNLGIRSENISSRLQNDGANISEKYIKVAKSLIANCFVIESLQSEMRHLAMSSSAYDFVDIRPILFTVFSGDTISDIIRSLRQLEQDLNALEDEGTLSEEKIKGLRRFFKTLSEASVKRSDYIAQTTALERTRDAEFFS